MSRPSRRPRWLPALVAIAVLFLARPAPSLPPGYPNDPLFAQDPRHDVSEQWNLMSDGRGISVERAWALTTGNPSVVIANIDVGVNYAHEDLREQMFVNTGEMPLPEDESGQAFAAYDANGDGGVGIEDWARDPRVTDWNGNGVLDAGDLIHAFSDGVDSDENGFVDDICGWDFADDDNDPADATGNGHGTQTSSIAAARTNNGIGMAGVCPNCRVLPIRVGDHQETLRPDTLAQGVVYAADVGASALSMSIGTIANPRFLQEAFRYAESHGVAAAAASGNEHSFHHNLPANYPEVMAVGAIQPSTSGQIPLPWRARDFERKASYSDYGGHLFLTAPSWIIAAKYPNTYYEHVGGTSSATPHIAGAAGLLFSMAKSIGLAPPLIPREVRQVLRASADDIVGGPYDCIPGFDQWTAYGRVNVGAAVERVASRRIPPAVRIDDPPRFAPLDPGRARRVPISATVSAREPLARIVLEAAPGVEPAETAFETIASHDAPGDSFTGIIGEWDLSRAWKRAMKDPAPAGPNRYSWTLRLRAEAGNGEMGEDRQTVFVRRDPEAHKGFPITVGASGEASLAAADLDGDGRQEIVIALSSGEVRVIDADGKPFSAYRGEPTLWPYFSRPAAGLDPASPRNHLSAPAYATGGVEPARSPVLASPAIADLDRDGEPEIVIATMDGDIVALHPDGKPLAGFPVRAQPDAPPSPPLRKGFLSSPCAADLDGDGDLEIVAAGMDATVHALHHDGRPVDGWPVLVRDPAGDTSPAPIVATPATGDIDADGREEIVVGTGELSGSAPFKTGRVYCFSGEGHLKPGWPVRPSAPVGMLLPIVGEGVVANPVLADMDGDGRLEIAVTVVTGMPKVYRPDGSLFSELMTAPFGYASDSAEPGLISVPGGASLADLDGNGVPEYLLGGIGLSIGPAKLFEGLKVPFDFLFGAWDVRSGRFLPAFPRVADGFHFFISAPAADIDGDGEVEALDGTSHYLLHAYKASGGEEPPGWPKSTGGWLVGTPFIGDLDGDGMLEVLASTRDGYVFCWDTTARATGVASWPSFQHDTWHTGRYGADTIPPAAVNDLKVRASGGGVSLRFAAVGNDLWAGRASRYLVLRSADPLSITNRSSSESLEVEAPPAGSGGSIKIEIPGASSHDHFAVQAIDAAGNLSPLPRLASW